MQVTETLVNTLVEKINAIAKSSMFPADKKSQIANLLVGKYEAGLTVSVRVSLSPGSTHLLAIRGKFGSETVNRINVKPGKVLTMLNNMTRL